MCNSCSYIELKECFYTPEEYEKTMVYIKELVEKQKLVLVDGNCEIGSHKNQKGQWVDDIVFHTLKCPECGQVFHCSVNTYRGGGAFKKG